MNIFVTGATGFLGTALCHRLETQGHHVTRLQKCDLTLPNALAHFDTMHFDQIFHLAAWTQAGDWCLHHAGEQWIVNQKINTHVLSWWKDKQPQAKLISIGTSCAYDPELPLVENNYLRGCPIESLLSYAMTKRMLYTGQLALHKQYGLQYLVAVPSTLYGPGYHTDDRQQHFIFDVVRKILVAKQQGGRVTLWGDGYQRRELIYIDDFISGLLEVNRQTSNTIVNIGSGQDYTIREFAQLICELVSFDFSRIDFDTEKHVGAKAKLLSVDRFRELLPNHTLTPLKEGLAAVIEWFETSGLVVR